MKTTSKGSELRRSLPFSPFPLLPGPLALDSEKMLECCIHYSCLTLLLPCSRSHSPSLSDISFSHRLSLPLPPSLPLYEGAATTYSAATAKTKGDALRAGRPVIAQPATRTHGWRPELMDDTDASSAARAPCVFRVPWWKRRRRSVALREDHDCGAAAVQCRLGFRPSEALCPPSFPEW